MGGTCHKAEDFASASKICADAGARLCTVAELQADVAKGTSCRLDKEHVWTSDTCGVSGAHVKRFTNLGKNRNGSPICRDTASGSPTFGVRCCGDAEVSQNIPIAINDVKHTVEGADVVDTTESLATVKAQPKQSTKTCDQLNWPYRSGNTEVCAVSFIDGKCLSSQSFLQAEKTCTTVGGRLCTAEELQQNAAQSSGCGFDNAMVWTSTECPDDPSQTLMAKGMATDSTAVCASQQSTAAVRCCADTRIINPDGSPKLAIEAESGNNREMVHWIVLGCGVVILVGALVGGVSSVVRQRHRRNQSITQTDIIWDPSHLGPNDSPQPIPRDAQPPLSQINARTHIVLDEDQQSALSSSASSTPPSSPRPSITSLIEAVHPDVDVGMSSFIDKPFSSRSHLVSSI